MIIIMLSLVCLWLSTDGKKCFQLADEGKSKLKSLERRLDDMKEDARCFNRKATGLTTVELFKKDRATLGLILAGGSDKDCRPKIANLRPGSIAHRSDLLCVGDNILSVNGIRTSKLKHEEIANLLKNAGDRVMLEVEYDLPSSIETLSNVCSKVIQVRLEKENGSFGFVLRGGVNVGCPLTVTHVRPGGPADREGTIKSGDRLLAIDNHNLHSISCGDVSSIFLRIEREAVFTVEYDISLMEAVRNASGPLLVEIDRGFSPANQQLGVALSASPHNPAAILIQSIKQASLAERCGALHVGDQLLAIDGVSLDSNATAAEASQLLRNSCGEKICLEILPLSQMLFGKRLPEVTVRKGTTPSSSISSFATLSGAASRKANTSNRRLVLQSSASNASLPSSLSSCMTLPSTPTCTQVCRHETTEVMLISDYRGFGFALRSTSASHPVIGSFDPGGPAECSGVIQVGDRVLAVDGMTTDGLSMEQITHMISASKPKVTLLLEFDIAESIVPSSGIFDIKLPCHHGISLGISITAAKDNSEGAPPLISEVRRGSVAHRTGTVQVGDHLLAIGDHSVDDRNVDDAISRLQEGQDDVVCLRIRKGAKGCVDDGSGEEQELLREGWVIYSVELKRIGNGPLGITLSGSDEFNRPIIVSAITDGGIAERTGALHPGDRLLAIDGHSVHGKSLGQVIQQLQSSVDSIFLKVSCRKTNKCQHPTSVDDAEEASKCGGTPQLSIDSAVDSWDGEESNSAVQQRSSPSASNILEDFNEKEEEVDEEEEEEVAEGKIESREQSSKNNWRRISSNSSRESNLSDEELDRDWVKILSEFGAKDANFAMQRRMSEENLAARGWNNNKGATHNTTCSTLPHGCGRQNRPRAMTIGENNQSAPYPIELHRVTLFKDSVYEDFGFSVSDGLYEKGVYVNRIRPGGPADNGGILKPFDRILQVNDTKTHDFDCCLTVPLIAAAGDRIHLVVVRNPCSSAIGLVQNGMTWMEEEDKELAHALPSSVANVNCSSSTIVKSF